MDGRVLGTLHRRTGHLPDWRLPISGLRDSKANSKMAQAGSEDKRMVMQSEGVIHRTGFELEGKSYERCHWTLLAEVVDDDALGLARRAANV